MDTKTILLVAVIYQATMTLGLLLASWRQRVYPGFGFWALSYLANAAGLSMLILRGTIPELVSVILGNLLLIMTIPLFHEGLKRFHGSKGRSPLLLDSPAVLINMATSVYFTLVVPSVSWRIVLYSLMNAALCLHLAVTFMLDRKARHYVGQEIITWSFAAFGVYMILRATVNFLHPARSLIDEGSMLTLTLVLLTIFTLVTLIGCLSLTNERAINEKEKARESLQRLLQNLRGVAYRVQAKPGGLIEYVSGAIEDVSGYPPERFIGKPQSEFLKMVVEEDVERVMGEVLAATGAGRPFDLTFRARHADSRILWLWDIGVGVSDETGEITHREGFIIDVTGREESAREHERLVCELQKALEEVKLLSGLIPICAACKKIRDDKGYWNSVEKYFSERAGAKFTHGICPDCVKKLYPLAPGGTDGA